MPVMSAMERAFCRSGLWRAFTRRVVVPWALDGIDLDGEVLELGSGSGTVAEVVLARFPSIRLTATDVDPSMVETAHRRLAPFGDRVEVDATRLPFPNGRFNAVVSFISCTTPSSGRRPSARPSASCDPAASSPATTSSSRARRDCCTGSICRPTGWPR